MQNDDKKKDDKTSASDGIKKFIKKNPAFSASMGTIILWCAGIFLVCIIMVALMYSIVAAFTTRFGIKETNLTKSTDTIELNKLSLEDLQNYDFESCYKMNEGDDWGAFWKEFADKFTVGANSECELLELIQKTIEKQENKYSDYGLKLDPGLVVSTLIYSYSSQPRQEGEKVVDAGQPMEVLADIINDNIITLSDIEEMVNNMVFFEAYWYYTCEETNCEIEEMSSINSSTEEPVLLEHPGKQCRRDYYFNVKFDIEKYDVFLRYGAEAAHYYQAATNHNTSVEYTCSECYENWNDNTYNEVTLDVDKYLTTADVNTTTADNLNVEMQGEELEIIKKESNEAKKIMGNKYPIPNGISYSNKTYTYKDGFIYNKFPNFKPAFDTQERTENDIFTPKTIEAAITSMDEYAKTMNKIYGLEFVYENATSIPTMSVKHDTAREVCPTDEGCSCGNGNRSPENPGVENPLENEEVCSILANNTIKNIRLITCPGETDHETRLPGGGKEYDTTEDGKRFKANELISWQEYMLGLVVKEISASDPVEALKFQMLLAQTYALQRLTSGDSSSFTYNSEEKEYYFQVGECAQSYNYGKYVDNYLSGKYKSNLDEAYNAIMSEVVVDKSNNLVEARYGSKLQNAFISLAKKGIKYTEMFQSPNISSYRDGIYEDVKISACRNLLPMDPALAKDIIEYARSFVGYTRQEFQNATDVNTSSSWCARFVSYILSKVPNSFNYDSASVSSFMNNFFKQGRFCHSKHWVSQSGKYVCANTPQPGDLILFAKDSCNYKGDGIMPTKTKDCWRHIGIVSGVSESTVTYIHGNTSLCADENGVCETDRDLNDITIVGYIR